MWQGRHTGMQSHADVHQRLLNETVLILDRTFRLRNESGPEPSRSGFDLDWRGGQNTDLFFQQWIEREGRNPFTIDGYFDFLPLERFRQIPAKQLAQVVVIKFQLEVVFAVSREVV